MLIGYKTELSIARFNKNCIEGQSLGGRNLVFRCLRMAENFKDKISPSEAAVEMTKRAVISSCHRRCDLPLISCKMTKVIGISPSAVDAVEMTKCAAEGLKTSAIPKYFDKAQYDPHGQDFSIRSVAAVEMTKRAVISPQRRRLYIYYAVFRFTEKITRY